MSAAATLTPREQLLVDAIAERLFERLRAEDEASRPSGLVDARAVALMLGVDSKTVYRHADKLGAMRIGRRLRFDLDRALQNWQAEESDRCPSERSQLPRSSAKTPTTGARRTPPPNAHCRLLPVGRRIGPK